MKRILIYGWLTAFLLGAAAPISRVYYKVPIAGHIPVYIAVGVMIVTLLLLKKRGRPHLIALTANASALACGVATGFLILLLLSGKPLPLDMALRWGAISIVLIGFFLADIRAAKGPTVPEPDLVRLPSEEIIARIEAYPEEKREEQFQILQREAESYFLQLRRERRKGLLFFLVGALVLGSSFWIREVTRAEKAKAATPSAQVK